MPTQSKVAALGRLTITILVKQGEGLLEFSNLFFGKLIGHGGIITKVQRAVKMCHEQIKFEDAVAIRDKFVVHVQVIPEFKRSTEL